jgi:hypothetical protein
VEALKFLALVALLASIAWCIAAPGYESAVAIVTSLSALLGAAVGRKRCAQDTMQSQTIRDSAVGVQAGRDVTVSDINTSQNRKRNAE